MDWRTINFDWNHVKAFWVTAQEGSLSAAARALKLAQPTLGRQVAALEKQLGVILFERYGRGLKLTPSGKQFLEPLQKMGDAAAEISLLAAGQSDTIEGRVCLSATDTVAQFMLPPVLQALTSKHPGIMTEVVVTNNLSNLHHREADIALRTLEPQDEHLIARKLCTLDCYLYATPAYLASLKLSSDCAAKQLEQAKFIGFSENDELIKHFNKSGLSIEPSQISTICDSHSIHWQFVKAGLGIGVMLQHIGDADKSVVRACRDFSPLFGELWLVTHRELHSSRRIKTVFDFLYDSLGREYGHRI